MIWYTHSVFFNNRTPQILIIGPLYTPLRTTKLSGGWNSSNHATSEASIPVDSTMSIIICRSQKIMSLQGGLNNAKGKFYLLDNKNENEITPATSFSGDFRK